MIYSKATTATMRISLRTGGEATNLKNRFGADSLSFVFRPGLDPLLALDTEICL